MEHPYRHFLHRLERPARYLGAEHGVIRKEWDAVRSRFCLAFPDTYELGMSHLGLKVLYETLGAEPDLMCERAFAPWGDLEVELVARGLPLVSLESARPLGDFHVVGFSLQFELTFTTVLAMLQLGGIPLRAALRGEADPLVLGGGPVASHPEPVAPFFDLFLLGDAERTLPDLLRQEADLRERGAPRDERVALLGARPEVYAPSLTQPRRDDVTGRLVVGEPDSPQARRHIEWDLDALVDTGGGPVPSIEAVFDRAALEVARGCNQGCRFCQAGFLYRPLRERRADQVLSALGRRAAQGGYDEVSLTALSTADYSALAPLLGCAAATLAPLSVSMSVSSLRAIGLEGDLLDDLRTGRAGSLTFAPEAGSQTMRDRINKRISEPGLLETAGRVAARGWSHIKLYFMIGLPRETDEDVIAILELAERVRRAAREAAPHRAPRVTCNVNTFVPKPHTPMQWCAMLDSSELGRRQALLRSHPAGRNLGLRLHNIPMSLLEGQLARGDRSLGDVVEKAYLMGARFDGWEDHFDAARWANAFAEAGEEPARWLEAMPVGKRLPWDHIHIGVSPIFLEKEHSRMERGRVGSPCGVPTRRDPDVRAELVAFHAHGTGSFAARGGTGSSLPERLPEPKLACLACGLPCLEVPPRRAAETWREDAAPEDAGSEGSRLLQAAAGNHGPDEAISARAAITTDATGQADQAEARRLRLVYEKRGPAAFLSHLDLVRHLPRILRRAGLQPAYSQGFNPRPRLQFTPPLPLGAEAEADACDVWVLSGPKEDLLSRLQESTLPGVSFASARWLGDEEPAISRLCVGAVYLFEADTPCDPSLLEARIAALGDRSNWVVSRKSKGGGKGKGKGRGKGGGARGGDGFGQGRGHPPLSPRDLRASLGELSLVDGPSGAKVVRFLLYQRTEGTLRPREILEAVFETAEPGGKLTRLYHTDRSGARVGI